MNHAPEQQNLEILLALSLSLNVLFSLFPDDDGWLDVLGSGRLKKRTVVEGDTSAAKPRNGQTVKFHKKGKMIFSLESV